ncbi:PorH family porin [Corynebacterium casei]|uniref:PorH family porin n=1 Tax=Corynebacterium casei TaxID=160386 RepID=UPI003F8E3337
MDLSFVQEQLDTFATFAGAIGDFLQKPAEILTNVFGWFGDGFGDDANTIDGDWKVTKDAFGSSEDASGSSKDAFGSSEDASGSSKDSE